VQLSNSTDNSFDDSFDECTSSKSSSSPKNSGHLIGAGQSLTHIVSNQNKCWDIDYAIQNNINVVCDQTSFSVAYFNEEGQQNYSTLANSENESNNSDDSKPKKKTRRGGKRARQQRARQAGVPAQNAEEPAPATKEPKEQIKYKTELCKNWIEKGKCSYSVRCKFAHGPHELVQNKVEERPQQLALCEAFHNEGYCSYGIRCVYRHETRNVFEINKSYFGKNITFLPHELANLTVVRKRLPIFKEIAPIAKLSITSSANTFFVNRFCATGQFQNAPSQDSLNFASDSSECNSGSYEMMNVYSKEAYSFMNSNMPVNISQQGIMTLKAFESFKHCTNFKNIDQTNFDAQQLVSGYTK
jgi:hypothetical protein